MKGSSNKNEPSSKITNLTFINSLFLFVSVHVLPFSLSSYVFIPCGRQYMPQNLARQPVRPALCLLSEQALSERLDCPDVRRPLFLKAPPLVA